MPDFRKITSAISHVGDIDYFRGSTHSRLAGYTGVLKRVSIMPFIALEKRDKLEDGYCRRIKVQRQTLLLIQSQGQLFLIDALCPHGQASLAKGTIGDGCIRCPKHGIVFDLTTGGAVGGEAVSDIAPLTTYPLEDRDGVIGVNWHS